MVSVKNVSKIWDDRKVLDEISFDWDGNGNLAIIGESGSGKSTLLKCIGGVVQPASGEIYVNGNKVLGPDWHLLPVEEGIGYVSQHFELPRNYHVLEMLNYANALNPQQLQLLIEYCRLKPLLSRMTHHGLSGGEKQRVNLAVTLTRKPHLLLLDEPFANMDSMHNHLLRQMLLNWKNETGLSMMMASHNATEVLEWADEILVIQKGKLVQRGKPEEIYYQPFSPYVADLLGPYSLLPSNLIPSFAETPNRKIFFRPAQLTLEDTGLIIAKGTVTESLFRGDHYLNKIDTEAGITWVAGNRKAAGDSVTVHTPLSRFWSLPS